MKRIVNKILRLIGYQICRIKGDVKYFPVNFVEPAAHAYTERDECGAINIKAKIKRLESGLPFEWSNIINLNAAVVSLIGDAKSIVELGSGTGKFAMMASEDPSRQILANELDSATHKWCLANLPKKENVKFSYQPFDIDSLPDPFDLVVAIEVVEHVKDYECFLHLCSKLASRAIVTTPNRLRSAQDSIAGPPVYSQHVREWTAGEFYWVLRLFWDDVVLYGMTSETAPEMTKVDVNSTRSPLIADCRQPRVVMYVEKN